MNLLFRTFAIAAYCALLGQAWKPAMWKSRLTLVASAVCVVGVCALNPSSSLAIADTPDLFRLAGHQPTQSSLIVSDANGDLSRLRKGNKELQFLLENWDKKTTYCNFGEFQNELLNPAKKEQLLIEAAAGGLLDYDKSATMKIMCKRDPQMVRAFAGLTNENVNLQKAEVLMKRPSSLDRVSDEDMDRYQEQVEEFTQSVSEVDLVTYAARTDYGSTETRSREDEQKAIKDQKEGVGKKDYMAQSRDSVLKMSKSLDQIVDMLHIE